MHVYQTAYVSSGVGTLTYATVETTMFGDGRRSSASRSRRHASRGPARPGLPDLPLCTLRPVVHAPRSVEPGAPRLIFRLGAEHETKPARARRRLRTWERDGLG